MAIFNLGSLDLVSIIWSKGANSTPLFKGILCAGNPGSYSNEQNLVLSSKKSKTRKDEKLCM